MAVQEKCDEKKQSCSVRCAENSNPALAREGWGTASVIYASEIKGLGQPATLGVVYASEIKGLGQPPNSQ
jgi:hypothetical protein